MCQASSRRRQRRSSSSTMTRFGRRMRPCNLPKGTKIKNGRIVLPDLSRDPRKSVPQKYASKRKTRWKKKGA